LIENELFGAAPGGHAGAVREVVGKISAARSGTLFLDEISELPIGAQAKLLQFLPSKNYYPLGASQPRHSDARLVAASNVDLRRAVAEKRFREDLLWRLDVVTIRLPSLAERQIDLDELIDHFCRTVAVRHGLAPVAASPAARRAIKAAEWPGNVRQLEHTIEAAAIRAAAARTSTLGLQHLFPGQRDSKANESESFQEATRSFQADLLRRTLVACDWNVSECARRLDLARSHVYTLIQSFDLPRENE
jgi:Nif-specific regulatory protein